MPLVLLPDPPGFRFKVWRTLRTIPFVVFLAVTLVCGNLVQLLGLVVLPFSSHVFRSYQTFWAWLWWGWCVLLSRRLNDARLLVSGDRIPMEENAIVVVNHQRMTDIPVILTLAMSRRRLPHLKWFVRFPMIWAPGVGWALLFLDSLFVKRNWTKDGRMVERIFSRLLRDRVPMWLINFAEGTRISFRKLEKSRERAVRLGMQPLSNVLLPRTRGFAAAVLALRGHVGAVYDVTIGYANGVPSLWQWCKGYAPVTHIHVRRYLTDALPDTVEALMEWLDERFREKDALLDHLRAHGRFPLDEGETPELVLG